LPHNMTIKALNNSNYSDFLESGQSVLVISESWCPTCAEYKPIIQAVSDELTGIDFYEAVLDQGRLGRLKRDHQDLIENIRYLPTTLLFEKGELKYQIEGAVDYDEAVAEIEEGFAQTNPSPEREI